MMNGVRGAWTTAALISMITISLFSPCVRRSWIHPGVAIDPGVLAGTSHNVPDRRTKVRRIFGCLSGCSVLPPFGDRVPVSPRFEHATTDTLRLGARQPRDESGSPDRQAALDLLGRPPGETLRQARIGAWGNRIHRDTEALELARRHNGQSRDSGLRRSVVPLSHVAEDARVRGRVNHATIDGLPCFRLQSPVDPGVVHRQECAL